MTWLQHFFKIFRPVSDGAGDAHLKERLRLLAKVENRIHADGVETLMADIQTHGTEYQSECTFIYCINSAGRVMAHSISDGLVGADLRQQLNGQPLEVLEKLLQKKTARPRGEVHYYLNPRIRVEMSYQVFGEIIVIAQSKLIPATSS